MKMTNAEIREQMKTCVWVCTSEKDEVKRILAYLKENGFDGPDPYPDPKYGPHPNVRYWPIRIDFVNKKAEEVVGVLCNACYSSGHEIITVERFFRLLEVDECMKEKEVKKIYFDMDGVLADFNRGVEEFCHMEAPSLSGPYNPEQDEEMWRRIKNVDRFYYKLHLMPEARELFDAVYEIYGDRCEILTGIPKPERGIETAGKDKEDWIHDFFRPDIKVNVVRRKDKIDFCTGKDCILIDDMEKNIREWTKEGGTGIRNISAEETIKTLRELGYIW